MNQRIYVILIAGFFVISRGFSAEDSLIMQNERELAELASRMRAFKTTVISNHFRGTISLGHPQSMIARQFRNVEIDPHPPVLGSRTVPYSPHMSSGLAPGDHPPYEAVGIKPFRFRFFHNEFNYGGSHHHEMVEYAASHGFDIILPHGASTSAWSHLPTGTRWLRNVYQHGGVNWAGSNGWIAQHLDLPTAKPLRFDLLRRAWSLPGLVTLLQQEGAYQKGMKNVGSLMLDIEHEGPLLPSSLVPFEKSLQGQSWYPKHASDAEKAAFEKAYYEGYQYTMLAPFYAAKAYDPPAEVGIYAGGQTGALPFGRTWSGLENRSADDPLTQWKWQTFAKPVVEKLDLLYPSVYWFYWNHQNVAYTLANIDLNQELNQRLPQPRKIRPYFWNLLHTGTKTWRWQARLPVQNHDFRAAAALNFFTGTDGLVLWSSSREENHHQPPSADQLRRDLEEAKKNNEELIRQGLSPDYGVTLSAKSNFRSVSMDGKKRRYFKRYDAIRVLHIDDKDQVQFQRVNMSAKTLPKGEIDLGPPFPTPHQFPVYQMPYSELATLVRAKSEPVRAMIAGMAMAKAFEFMLAHGELVIDVPATEQFKKRLPIVRRVKLGDSHLIATYNPYFQFDETGLEPVPTATVELKNFDGIQGLHLQLLADLELRFYLVKLKKN